MLQLLFNVIRKLLELLSLEVKTKWGATLIGWMSILGRATGLSSTRVLLSKMTLHDPLFLSPVVCN